MYHKIKIIHAVKAFFWCVVLETTSPLRIGIMKEMKCTLISTHFLLSGSIQIWGKHLATYSEWYWIAN